MENRSQTFILSLKYVLLAILTGVLVGIIDAVFGRGLLAISDFRTTHYLYLIPFLPFAGLLITWMYHHFSETSLKGMTLVFETGQKKRDDIPLFLIPLVMFGTWITHLFGGSAGREGVAVQIGATLSHALGRRFHLPKDNRVMLITGMAAGFGGLFQTPLAAVFFSMEVIVAGKIQYEALLPALIASYTAAYTSHTLGLGKFYVPLKDTLKISDANMAARLVILGILFGLAGRSFSFLLAKSKKIFAEKMTNPYIRIGVSSIPLALILFLLYNGRYSGLGTNLISAAFSDGTIYPYDWILKLLLTVLTLAIGYQGGEVTPLFSIGASLGIVLGGSLGLSPVHCAALGYAAVFAGATNTLFAPVLIGLEVFGTNDMVPFLIVCIFAYLVNGDNSIYAAQEVRK
ncbi:MAG TPA: voltage-gated chloride channel protein [Roseburia sp.]|nr:voltage-gated chloride channel protein [Roseburia sp.]